MVVRFWSATPLVISLVAGFLLGLVTIGLLRLRRGPAEYNSPGNSDALLLGLLTLAAFALGVFLTYVLFGVFL
jgi:hypothetical protein